MLGEMNNATLIAGWSLVGLMIGSFLNVVIHRLPIILETQWAEETARTFISSKEYFTSNSEHLQLKSPTVKKISLATPASQCPHCGYKIKWYENIPIISFLLLRGKCSACKAVISPRYPIIELLNSILFGYCFYRWGASIEMIFWSAFTALLLCLAAIDWDTTILPDDLNYALLWLALIASAFGAINISPTNSIFGAACGYLSLWSIYWIFKIITGKDGMGHGDFKLLSGIGAWLGAVNIIQIMILSSIFGLLIATGLKVKYKSKDEQYIPFGPSLACAAYLTLIINNHPSSIIFS
jgi:leader peptidase (prepilin peptidase) / N-methyltransferase